MSLLSRLLALLGFGREAPIAPPAPPIVQPEPQPGPGDHGPHQSTAIPIQAVGETGWGEDRPILPGRPDPAPAAPAFPRLVEVPVATSDRFAVLIDPTIGREGGYANHPDDRGGETMWGITIARARAAGYRGAMRDMPRAAAVDIYRLFYWSQPGFDGIDDIDPGLGERLLDAGINCGTDRAGRWLQRALNVLNGKGTLYSDIEVDGKCGALTRAALQSFIQRRGAEGRQVLLECVRAFQAGHYLQLAEGDASQEAFVYGWMRNRIIGVG
jgi:lysozyme family protein